jgi:hypothetical protein
LIEQDSLSDGELIDSANAGDISSLETLYFRYRDWVVNLAFHFIADRELALDVLQDTVLYFSKKFLGFQLTCQMKSFLYPPKVSRWQKWMPLAASILIAASIFYFSMPQRSVADLNGDGKVDVIDALILANQLKSGAIHEADVNGDGAVDQKDVQEIAARSVHLDEREQL